MAEKDVLYHELLEALQAGGCPVCRLVRRASDSYLHAVIYEGVTDVKLRGELREARGLCYLHAWRLARQRGAVLGTTIVYQDVVNTLVKVLEAAESSPARLFGRSQQELARALAPTAPCPACRLEEDSEHRTSNILLKHLGDVSIAAAYQLAGGLCLPHLQVALASGSASAVKTLARWQAEAWRRLRSDLDELIRKHDHRFSSEPVTDAESISWQRAIAGMVGEAEPPGDKS